MSDVARVDARADLAETATPPKGLSMRSRLPRGHLIALVAILLVGFVRGLFWVVTAEVWYPIDEAQHYAYVQSLAEGDGIPVVGKDRVSVEVLDMMRRSDTSVLKSSPIPIDADDPNWGVAREQYEGVQPPLYYALLVPVYWASRPLGVLPSVFALRLASLVFALLAVPLTYLLARELFPRIPVVWLASSAVLVLVHGFNFEPAVIGNDAMLIPASIAPLVVVARVWTRGLTSKSAVYAGALLGLALLVKSTAFPAAALAAWVILAMVVSGRERMSTAIRWGLVFAGTALVMLLPWFIWNLRTYGALTGSEAVDRLTGALQAHLPFGFDTVRWHFAKVRHGYWDLERTPRGIAQYGVLLEAWAIASLVAGLIACRQRRDRDDAARLVWLGASFLLTFAAFYALISIVFGESVSVVGRHLYVALAPTCVLMAAGFVIALGPRRAMVVLLAMAALALSREQASIEKYLRDAYGRFVIAAELIPRVEQLWNDQFVPAAKVRIDPPCSTPLVGFLLQGRPPRRLAVNADGVESMARRLDTAEGVTLYAMKPPASRPFEVTFPSRVSIGSSHHERSRSLSFPGLPSDPAVQVYCRARDPFGERFAQRYPPQHPYIPLSYGRALAWGTVWAWLLRLAFCAMLVGVIRKRRV